MQINAICSVEVCILLLKEYQKFYLTIKLFVVNLVLKSDNLKTNKENIQCFMAESVRH
jgi:hypothetical protein